MTDQERKDLRSYCAFLHKEYGFQFSIDNPALPTLCVIHKEMLRSIESNNKMTSVIKDAASKLNPTVFNFYSDNAAFKFQLGVAIKWISSGLLILLFIAVAVWHYSVVQNIDEANNIIQASRYMDELFKGIRKNKEGYFFIDFTAAKGDTIEYLKEFHKLDAKTIRVYIGKEAN